MVNDEAGVLVGIVFGLRSYEAAVVRRGVNFAVLEDGLRVTEDEIDVAFNVAVREVLARRGASWSVCVQPRLPR